jgi:hypothetical protein
VSWPDKPSPVCIAPYGKPHALSFSRVVGKYTFNRIACWPLQCEPCRSFPWLDRSSSTLVPDCPLTPARLLGTLSSFPHRARLTSWITSHAKRLTELDLKRSKVKLSLASLAMNGKSQESPCPICIGQSGNSLASQASHPRKRLVWKLKGSKNESHKRSNPVMRKARS